MSEEKTLPRTDEALKQIAVDFYDKKIYTLASCKNLTEIRETFVPIHTGALSGLSIEELAKIGLVFEYLTQSVPGNMSGRPRFMSMQILTKPELEKVNQFLIEIKKDLEYTNNPHDFSKDSIEGE